MCQVTHFKSLRSYKKKTNSLDIHSKKNLELMMIEVFKSLNHIGPEIIWDYFEMRDIPKLRHGQTILHAKSQTLNSFDFRASQAWNKLPGNIESLQSIIKFKSALLLQM